jgi:hypothetical protein
MAAAMAPFLQMQTTLLQSVMTEKLAQAPAPSSAPTSHATTSRYSARPTFPSWKDDAASKSIFLERVRIFCDHDFFASVTDWTCTTTATTTQSTHIRQEMMTDKRLPPSELVRLLHVPAYRQDGIRMLTNFVSHLSLNSVTDRLGAITELVELKMELGKAHSEYMLSIRRIGGRLGAMTIGEILPIFALANMDQDRFPELVARYLQGDSSLLKSTIYSLEVEMNDEIERQ